MVPDFFRRHVRLLLVNAGEQAINGACRMSVERRESSHIMAENNYGSGREQNLCDGLIDKYMNVQQYEKQYEKEVYLTRIAASRGDRDAQYRLARFCEDAIGVERDREQAAFWYKKAALQGHGPAAEKCRELGISLADEVIDEESIRKELKCRIFPLNYLTLYKFTVICSNFQGKWILSRHKKRDTWETQGGHIEAGETPLETAKRELFEESGIVDAELYPVCDYWGFNSRSCSNGMVFLAVVHSLGELPESEMREIRIFDELPSNLTYPQTTPVLCREVEKLLKNL